MSVLRDRRVAALNELTLRCQDAALRYRDAAALMPDSDLGARLLTLAGGRRRAADGLSLQVRRLGDLPDALDADGESARRLFSLAEATVAEGTAELECAVRDEVIALEQRISAQAEVVLALPVEDATRRLTEGLLQDSRDVIQHLS